MNHGTKHGVNDMTVLSSNHSTARLSQRWEHPEAQRYYEVVVEHDWFDWILTRTWGRQHTRLGGMTREVCADFAAGQDRLAQLDRQRQRRGYQVVMREIKTADMPS